MRSPLRSAASLFCTITDVQQGSEISTSDPADPWLYDGRMLLGVLATTSRRSVAQRAIAAAVAALAAPAALRTYLHMHSRRASVALFSQPKIACPHTSADFLFIHHRRIDPLENLPAPRAFPSQHAVEYRY
eukprot:SAG31_NODE_3917_length_3753_cov_2.846196_4_plen_131_part_00